MIKNFKDINSKIKYDIIIVGAGAAGITVALEFAQSNFKVALLESGSLNYNPDYQELMKGNISGKYKHEELDKFRLRQFGGTTNIWGAGVLPYDKIDFAKREQLKIDGWPIEYESLDKYYHRARKYVQIDNTNYEVDGKDNCINPKIVDSEILVEKNWLRCKKGANFKSLFYDNLKLANNIDVFLESTAVDIDIQETEIKTIVISNLKNEKKKLEAFRYILCCGGIETTRLLLNFNKLKKINIGNFKGALGKYYSSHVNVVNGIFINRPGIEINNDYFDVNNSVHERKFLSFNEKFLLKNNLLNFKSTFENLENNISSEELNEVRGLLGWSNIIYGSENIYTLNTSFEQTPCVNSRLFLSNEKDKLGLFKVNLNTGINEGDLKIYNTIYKYIGNQFGLYNLGLFKYMPIEQILENEYIGSSHHTGTCRMITESYGGVVDRDCKVFNTNNLFLSTSAIFPTPSHANPTFTIIALSIRLSDHIKNLSNG